MKRLIAICLSLPLVLGAAVAGGQEAGTAKSAAQNSSAKQQSTASKKMTTSHHAAKKHRKASARKGTKRSAYRPEYSDNSVEVINGDAAKKVVFHDDQAAASAKAAPRQSKKAPAGAVPMKVEVMNGSSTDTQYFSGKGRNEQIAAVRNQQVVVGVQSSNTRVAGGNKRPVVTSVNSAGSGDAKAAGNGEQPVTNSVSPRPKRPEYQPDEH